MHRIPLTSPCTSRSAGTEIPEPLGTLIRQTCLECHDGESAEGGLDLASLGFKLDNRELRDRWIPIHDRIELQCNGATAHKNLVQNHRSQLVLLRISVEIGGNSQ